MICRAIALVCLATVVLSTPVPEPKHKHADGFMSVTEMSQMDDQPPVHRHFELPIGPNFDEGQQFPFETDFPFTADFPFQMGSQMGRPMGPMGFPFFPDLASILSQIFPRRPPCNHGQGAAGISGTIPINGQPQPIGSTVVGASPIGTVPGPVITPVITPVVGQGTAGNSGTIPINGQPQPIGSTVVGLSPITTIPIPTAVNLPPIVTIPASPTTIPAISPITTV